MKGIFTCCAIFSLILLSCSDDSSSIAPETLPIASESSALEGVSSSSGTSSNEISPDKISLSSEIPSDTTCCKVAEISSSGVNGVSSVAEPGLSSSSEIASNVTAKSSSSQTNQTTQVEKTGSLHHNKTSGYPSNIVFIGDNLLFGKYMSAVELDRGRVLYYRKDSLMVETESQPTTLEYHGQGVSSQDKDFYGFIKKAYKDQGWKYTFYRAVIYNNSWELINKDGHIPQVWFEEYIHQQLSSETDAVVLQVESWYNMGPVGDTNLVKPVVDSIRAVAPQARIIWVGQWESEYFQFVEDLGVQYVPISQIRKKDTGSARETCIDYPDVYPYNLTCGYTCDGDVCMDTYLNAWAAYPNEYGYLQIATEILKALNEP